MTVTTCGVSAFAFFGSDALLVTVAIMPVGPMPIGYGDGDDATELSDMEDNYTTVYIRRTFTLANPAGVESLSVHKYGHFHTAARRQRGEQIMIQHIPVV